MGPGYRSYNMLNPSKDNFKKKLTKEEIENLNSSTSIKDAEFTISSLLTRKQNPKTTTKIWDSGGFTDELYQTFKEEIAPILHKVFQKIEEKISLYKGSIITEIPKPKT